MRSSLIETPTSRLQLSPEGRIAELAFLRPGGWEEIKFRQDAWGGPAWIVDEEGTPTAVPLKFDARPGVLTGRLHGVDYHLEYRLLPDRLELLAELHNTSWRAFCPRRCSLRLGVDTYMESYPQWDTCFFPTLLRCETTHFWGYAMSPLGRILGIASPDPVASWSLEYNFAIYGTTRHEGHRIYTINLDLLQELPVPSRHPQKMDWLGPGERRTWSVSLIPLEKLTDVQPALAKVCRAPMIACERLTLLPGESTIAQVFGSDNPQLTITWLDGSKEALSISRVGPESHFYTIPAGKTAGVSTLTASNKNGAQAEARIYTRQPWSWYLQQARAEAIRMPQKASTHMESWLGCFSAFLARKYFPDPKLDALAEARFAEILPLMYDTQAGVPTVEAGRIQNTAAMIGLLADAYEASGKLEYLELAARLADWLMRSQGEDGAYRAFYGAGVHYTSVSYLAKYMLELALVERRLGMRDSAWQERADRHYDSAARAVDDLERLRDNIGTEGEHTFEDGMIACTAAQLGMFALLQDVEEQRTRYVDAAQFVLNKHRCLRQLLPPDCRVSGATLRFWEAQYDVLIKEHNMLNSPHGWTSWKTYATWYLYQLTGHESYLRETMDTLGACMQMIDVESGRLRWAFVPDPVIHAKVFQPDPEHPGQGQYANAVLGEQYVPMISDWWQAGPHQLTGGYWDQGGCCDNDVHEHFKCLEEVALTSAYVIEQADGSFHCWNCQVESDQDMLRVTPAEQVVHKIHFNLIQARQFYLGSAAIQVKQGLSWVEIA